MKSSLPACLTTVLFMLVSLLASAERSPLAGTISFSGAIVHSSCNMNVSENPVALQCHDPISGKRVATTTDIMNLQSPGQLPVTVETQWLDAAKRKGIVSVNYL